MSIQFRAGVDEGLIMGLMTSKNPESIRVALYLKDGMTTFELVNSAKRRDLKHEFGANLCDGRWHNASVHLSAHDITLTIDEVSFTSSRIITESEELGCSGCSNDYNLGN
uniref:Laminin G domain-containing protein n=1 Tax=Parascaris equorum TaxID=6256 RepID=A0A914RKX1_PAREQ